MKNKLLLESMQNILHTIDEGIHIVDQDGKTIFYNSAMEKIEGLSKEEVIGKYLLDVFPNWVVENSTLLSALESGEKIDQQRQSYLNLKGEKISTENTTFPIFEDGSIIGAVEIARNFTDVSNLSEQIIDLQQKLIKPKENKRTETRHYTFENMIGQSINFLKAIKIAKRATETSSSVLIQGDTGTGKELFAQSIHYESPRADKPFIAQNCAAIPDTLLESILFGTAKGSFTGASERPGIFEQANGGTLFLDEINSMSIQLQAKLLRVLQESYVRRVGGMKDIPIDVRIIAASNEDPIQLMEDKLLRKDLFYRLNVINIRIPSLQERSDDIKLLSDYFIRIYNKALNKDVWMLSEELNEAFKNYQWVGNVRELQNLIESAMNMVMDEHVITREHLPAHFEGVIANKSIGIKGISPYDESEGINPFIEKIEKEIIEKVLIKHNFNVTNTSKDLKISRQNLQYKIKKFKIIESKI